MAPKRIKPEPRTPDKALRSDGEDDEADGNTPLDSLTDASAGEQNSAKRHKHEDRPRGQVLKVRMKNFMTYGDVTVIPGPLLNLVLGPNGTGKSSLVNALCLGLGGNAALLGRADRVSDFVRKGHSTGSTEVHLSSGTRRPIVITRTMNSLDSSSKWHLNGKSVTMAKVQETVAELRIQVDNLCQFLPQDKVVMFARLTPIQLLMETEKAIGSGELWDLHQQLITGTYKQTEDRKEAERLQIELTRNREQNSELDREVKRFQERLAVLQQVNTLNQKLPWVRYNDRKEEYYVLKENAKAKQLELAALTREFNLQQQPLAKHEKLAKESAQKLVREKLITSTTEKEVTDNFDAVYQLQEDMDDQQERIGEISKDVAIRKERIANLEKKVAASEDAISNLEPPPEADPQRGEELKSQLAILTRECSSKTRMAADLSDKLGADHQRMKQLEGRMGQMNDRKLQRLRRIEQRHPGISTVHKWIADNSNRFQGQVLGPISCEVECSHPLYQDMLEQTVPGNIWMAFVTSDKSDKDMLIRAMKDENWRWKPSIICNSSDLTSPISYSKGNPSILRDLGVEATLDQVFEAPSLIKHILCDEKAINDTYICSAGAEQHMDAFSQRRITSVWTPDSWFTTNTSAYNSRSRNCTVIPRRSANYLNVSAESSTARAQLEAEIAACKQAICAKTAQVALEQVAVQELETRKTAIKKEQHAALTSKKQYQNKLRNLESMLKADQKNLATAKDRKDPRENEPQMQLDLADMAAKALNCSKLSIQNLQKMWASMQRADSISLCIRELDLIVAALKRKGTHLDSSLQALQLEYDSLQRIAAKDKEDVKTALVAAEAATGGKVSQEQQEEFDAVSHLGSTVEEIEASTTKLRSEADAIVCNNPKVMEDYQNRADKIATLESQLKDLEDVLEALQEKLTLLQDEWLPQLERITQRINITFGRIFAKIACAGEVVLDVDKGNYDNCSMNIRVKFREAEDLQTLNAQRQSGGERSVCTVLYLVALQDVAACPFRIVDEINQGMDQYNERKVFLELVNAATGEGTPQSFLLTPKLLPGLPFSPAVTVLQIMNGYKIADVAEGFTHEAMLRGRTPITAC